jgi:hypothetical protein
MTQSGGKPSRIPASQQAHDLILGNGICCHGRTPRLGSQLMQFDRLKRREFVTLLGGATAWPLAARAQHMRRVGILVSFGDRDPEGQSRVSAFRQELERLGWSVGGNVHIDYRWVSDLDHAQASAAELAGLRPEVILAFGNANLAALRKETRSIPIVVVQAGDLVGSGFVASLAHPGATLQVSPIGNIPSAGNGSRYLGRSRRDWRR